MNDKRKRNEWIPIALGAVFGAVLLILVLNGGMCERYNKRMQRQQLMQDYLNSLRKK
ncbi:MAG: hypothetical protein NTX15_03885 [Candidatus Kapabacteria bacterium]|nr:hypothetical protein [Candidatus Kapabacteria bacterium]